jgi:gliding motility-associated-like protein
MTSFLPYRHLLLGVCLACLWVQFVPLKAQTVDEFLPADSVFSDVGAQGEYDFLAQSFVAGVGRLSKVGAWLRADSAGGQVQLTIYGHSPNGHPDLNYVVFQSALVSPTAAGAWVYDTITGAALSPGDTFWVALDGYQNLGATGFSSVGISSYLGSSQSFMLGSKDGGQTWTEPIAKAMAVYVEGDSCSVEILLGADFPAVCSGIPTTLTAPSGYLSYAWSNGGTSSSITVTQGGYFSVTVSDADLCLGSAFYVLPNGTIPDANLSPEYFFCTGDTLNVEAFNNFNSYEWQDGSTRYNLLVTEPGQLTVTVIDYDGCTSSDTAVVYRQNIPFVSLGTDTLLCQGDNLILDAGPEWTNYLWANEDTNQIQIVYNPGSFWVELTDSIGCKGISDTIVVGVAPDPETPTIKLAINGIQSSFGFTYTWWVDGLLLPEKGRTLVNPEPGIYHVQITNGYGCVAISDTFRVAAKEVGSFVSEGFSPNGDGLNEVFFIEGAEEYTELSLLVMNAWGDVVYESERYLNDWRGIGPTGKPLPDGVYYYVIRVEGGVIARKGGVVIHR